MTVQTKARAKINLTLHVGRKIADPHDPFYGYHPIDSLVTFADIGDDLSLEQTGTVHSLDITGPFAKGLDNGAENLILRALKSAHSPPTHVTLVKNLPVAAGIGGGSANAAAILRMLGQDDLHLAVGLGADVPVCLKSKTAHMTGIGEDVTHWPGLGQIHSVLVNPGIRVSTADIFKDYDGVSDIRDTPRPQTYEGDLLEHALDGQNDLQRIAIVKAPIIETVLSTLEAQAECRLARMSGSGATCFGLFTDSQSAEIAAQNIKSSFPDWWVVPTVLGDP